MRPGWHDFSRYNWLGPLQMCEPAVSFAIGRAGRAWGLIYMVVYPQQAIMPIPPGVRQIAERCGAALTAMVPLVSRGEGSGTAFWPAYYLALTLQRDDDALAMLVGQLTHAPWYEHPDLLDVWRLNTRTHPVRVSLVERYGALLDSLAQQPNPQKYQDYPWLALLAPEWLYKHFLRMGDTAQTRARVENFLKACTRLDPRGWSEICQHRSYAFGVLLNLAILEHGPRSPEVVALLNRDVRTMNEDSTVHGLVPPTVAHIGKPFVWPTTPFWYGSTGAPGQPGAAGQPSAVILAGRRHWFGTPPPSAITGQPRSGHRHTTRKTMTPVRRLLATYGPQGLQLVVLEHTRGSAPGVGAVGPEEEAPAIRQFYQEQLGLPAAVVVDTVSFKYIADGRRVNSYTKWERHYRAIRNLSKGVSGSRRIRYRGPRRGVRDGRRRRCSSLAFPRSTGRSARTGSCAGTVGSGHGRCTCSSRMPC